MDLKTLHMISYGMYVVSSKSGNSYNGQIVNTVFQLTSEPATVAISINKQNLTHEFISKSKVFAVSILDEQTPMSFIGVFGFKSGREMNKFKEVKYKLGIIGTPVIMENTVGFLEAEVVNTIDVDTHTLFIGRLVDAEIIGQGSPMTYEFYHQVKKGTAPKTAPTYLKEVNGNNRIINKKEDNKMKKYVCSICGYVYDPEVGDPDGGIAPGTAFEDIPDDWVCPVCGVGKDQFEEEA